MAIDNKWVPRSSADSLKKSYSFSAFDSSKKLFSKTGLDPKNAGKNVRGLGYGYLAVEAIDSVLYLMEGDNAQKTLDYWKNAFGFSSAPSAIPTSKTPKAVPVHKTITEKLNDFISVQNSNVKSYDASLSSLSDSIIALNSDRSKETDTMALSYGGNSPLLNNQLYLKNSIDNVVEAINVQTAVFSSIASLLDLHLGSLSAIGGLSLANSVSQSDAIKYQATSTDYGDADFFYSFVPTAQYWRDAQSAHLSLFQASGYVNYFPLSASYAGDEISLIDRLVAQGLPRSAIRKEVEAYRVGALSTDVRAMIGQSAVVDAKLDAEYKTSAIEANKSAVGVANSVVTSNAVQTDAIFRSAEATEALGAIVEPISRWAESAKVLSDYAQTPTSIKDLDGVEVAVMAPMVASAVKNITTAKTRTDTNSQEFDESFFPSLLDIPLIPFIGREDVFDPSKGMPAPDIFSPSFR